MYNTTSDYKELSKIPGWIKIRKKNVSKEEGFNGIPKTFEQILRINLQTNDWPHIVYLLLCVCV